MKIDNFNEYKKLFNIAKFQYQENPVFLFCNNKNQVLPREGWKIHISATPFNYSIIIKKTIKICMNFGVSFKYLKNYRILIHSLSSKGYRYFSGKFITIYPTDLFQFKNIINKLYVQLKRFHGPVIYNDKRYKKSKVIHYRYGLIRSNKGLWLTSKKIPYKSITKYFVPENVEEPFPSTKIPQKDDFIVKGKYKLVKNIVLNNMGGIYLIQDIKEKIYILKEKRYGIYQYDKNKKPTPVQEYLKNEAFLLKNFSKIKNIPKFYDLFKDGSSLFLIKEWIEGMTLSEYHKKLKYDPEYIHGARFRVIIINLMKIMRNFHVNNLIMNDVKSDNFVLNNNKLFFIDLEHTFKDGEKGMDISFDFIGPFLKKENYYKDRVKLAYLIMKLILKTKNSKVKHNTHTIEEMFFRRVMDFKIPKKFIWLVRSLLKQEDSSIDKIFNNFKKDFHEKKWESKPAITKRNIEEIIFMYEKDDFSKKEIIEIIDLSQKTSQLHMLSKCKFGNFELNRINIELYIEKSFARPTISIDSKNYTIKHGVGYPYIDEGDAGFLHIIIQYLRFNTKISKSKKDIYLNYITENLHLTDLLYSNKISFYFGIMGNIFVILQYLKYVERDKILINAINSALLLAEIFYPSYKDNTFKFGKRGIWKVFYELHNNKIINL